MELRLKYPPTPEGAPSLAEVAVSAAEKISGLRLDYSPQTLVDVDQQLEKFVRDGTPSDRIASTLFCFGCYVGEVLIRTLGGRWVRIEDSPMKEFGGPPIVVLMDNGYCWNPIGKVFQRVDAELGEAENLPYFFAVVQNSIGPSAR